MDTMTRLAKAVLVIGAGVACSVLAMVAVVAAVVFPMMKSLNPAIPDYAAYNGPHWMLLGGFVAARMFEIGFVIAGVSLSLCLASVLGLTFMRGSARIPIARLALVLLTLGFFLVHVGWLQPRMADALETFRQAAQNGALETAAEARSHFDGMHPTASRLLSATTISSLVLFIVSAWTASSRREVGPGEGGGGA